MSYDPPIPSGGFQSLVDDLNSLYARREDERRGLAHMAASHADDDLPLDTIAKSLGSWPAERAALEREVGRLKRNVERMVQRAAADQAAMRRQQIAAHREKVRRAIPELLTKALDLQKQEKCDALDVAKIQAEAHHLAAAWL